MCSKVIERRRLERERVLEKLRRYAAELRKNLGSVTLVLYGSYARGDFNAWSDIDVIIVSPAFEKVPPLKRYGLLPPHNDIDRLEPILWSPSDARKLLRKPAWRKALENRVVIADDLGLLGEKA